MKTISSLQKYRYVIVMPAKNEADTIANSLQSVVDQIEPPTEMIVVDDSSSDETASITRSFISKAPWLSVIKRNMPGPRKPGPQVVETFYFGLKHLKKNNYNFFVKMDADVVLDVKYFSRLLQRFEECPSLGIAGGITYLRGRKGLIREWRTAIQVWGGVKTYRRGCFEDIGGLMAENGWDTIDRVKARMRGWKVHNFEDMPIEHRRLMGSATGVIEDRKRIGQTQYYLGYHPFYVIAGATLKFLDPPLVIGSLGILWGYLTSLVRGRDRFNDHEFIQFLRAEQMNRLSFGLLRGPKLK